LLIFKKDLLLDPRSSILELLLDILGDCNRGVAKPCPSIDLALDLIHLSGRGENAQHGFLRFPAFKINSSCSVLLNNAIIEVARSMRETESIHSVIFKLYTMHEEIRRG
jgi:hypothetical protein